MFFLNTSTPLLFFNFPFAQSLGLPILPSFLLSFLPSFLLTLPPSAASRDCKGHLNPVWPSADDGDASRAERRAEVRGSKGVFGDRNSSRFSLFVL